MRMRVIVWWLLILLAGVGAWAQAPPADYTLLGTKPFSIMIRYEVRNVSAVTAENVFVKVYVGANPQVKLTDPPAQNDSLYQRKVRYRMSPPPATMTTDALGNTYGEFNLGKIAPGGVLSVEVEKFVLNSGISFSRDALLKNLPFDDFLAVKTNGQYLLPSANIESDSKAIKKAGAPYAALTDKPIAERAWLLYQTLNTFLSYDENPQFAHKGALNALNTRRGVCTEFSALYVALCRVMGIPARVVNGYWGRKHTFQVNVPVDVSGDAHAWAEFYLPGVGWIPVEPTLLSTVNGQRVANSNYFASLPITDRHFIWGYGLSEECDTGVSTRFFVRERPAGGQVLQAKIAAQTVKLLPDDAVQ